MCPSGPAKVSRRWNPMRGTGHVSQGRCLEASGMPRPMIIFAGERQLGQRASPNCAQVVALG